MFSLPNARASASVTRLDRIEPFAIVGPSRPRNALQVHAEEFRIGTHLLSGGSQIDINLACQFDFTDPRFRRVASSLERPERYPPDCAAWRPGRIPRLVGHLCPRGPQSRSLALSPELPTAATTTKLARPPDWALLRFIEGCFLGIGIRGA